MKKEATQNKNMTLDKLAVMVAKGFTNLEDRISGVESSMVTKDEFKEFKKETSESFVKVRADILNLNDRFVSNHKFEELVGRFNALEAKVKARK